MIYTLSFSLVKVIETNVKFKKEFEKFKSAFEPRWSYENMIKTIYPGKFSKIWKKKIQGTGLVLENCPKKWNLWFSGISENCPQTLLNTLYKFVCVNVMFCTDLCHTQLMFCNISTLMFCKMLCLQNMWFQQNIGCTT